MTLHVFSREFWLSAGRARVFAFFADARNLQTITPPWLDFRILTPGDIRLRAGAIIDYGLRLRGVPFRWRTEITVWEPGVRFVDVQRRGPYRHWQHTHLFSERDGGTLCRDEVEYAVPGGRLIEWLFVRRELRAIFAYREQALARHFPPAG